MRKTFNGTAGLWLAPNSETAPSGALKQALGVVVTRPGIIEKARPYRQYSMASGSAMAGTMAGLFAYGRALYQYTTVGALWKEGGGGGSGSFTVLSGTACIPPGSSTYVRTAEMQGNIYLTTNSGITKLDGGSTGNYVAGLPRGLDVQLTLVAAGTLLANTNSVGYRVCFGFLDANANLVLGAPSGRATTTATAAQNVTVKAWIPTSITAASNATSYFVQVYRTFVQTVASTDPGEEMQLVYQSFLTSTDVANKFISFTDATPDALRGAAGYFCPSQEGIANANYQPPQAKDVALFKSAMFYANTVSKYRARVQLLGVSKNLLTISTGAGGITKSGGNGVYTFTGSPDLTNIPTDGTAKLSVVNCTTAGNNGEFLITAVNTGAFTITVTNAAAATEAGTATARAFPSKLTIAGVNYYGVISSTAETPASQLFKVSTGNAILATGTPQQDVADTAASLLRVVNQQASPVVYGYYESGPDDGAGKMMFEEVSIGGSQFSLSAGGTLLFNSFAPSIPVAAPWMAQNDTASNRLYYSKQNQPEHVPLGNYFDIGARNKAILRIAALRDALLVFKEDGLFRLTGDGSGNWAVALFDASVVPPIGSAQNPGTKAGDEVLAVLRNRAYYLALPGVVSVSESSVTPIDQTISNLTRMYAQSGGAPRVAMSASDPDSIVYVYLSAGSALSIDRCFAYAVGTQTWTEINQTTSITDGVTGQTAFATLPSTKCAGLIYRQVSNGSIFAEDTVNNSVTTATGWQTAAQPTMAHKYGLTLTGSGGSTITATSDRYTPVLGSIIENPLTGGLWTVTNVAGTTYTVAALAGSALFNWSIVGHANGIDAYVYTPNPITVEWVPFTGGDEGQYCRFREAAVLIDGISTMTTCTLNAYTEATASTQTVNMTTTNTPLPSGIATQTLVRSLVPSNMQMARRLSIVFNHTTANEFVFIKGISYEFDQLDGNEVT
jgi:hypothetical protein